MLKERQKKFITIFSTALVTIVLWGIIGMFWMVLAAYRGGTLEIDDFSYGIKSDCYKRGLILNESCEFVSGICEGSVLASTNHVLFRVPDSMDLSVWVESKRFWSETMETPAIPEELGEWGDLVFYEITCALDLRLYRSEPCDGYIYLYFYY